MHAIRAKLIEGLQEPIEKESTKEVGEKMAKMCPLQRGRSMAQWQTKPKTRYFTCLNTFLSIFNSTNMQLQKNQSLV